MAAHGTRIISLLYACNKNISVLTFFHLMYEDFRSMEFVVHIVVDCNRRNFCKLKVNTRPSLHSKHYTQDILTQIQQVLMDNGQGEHGGVNLLNNSNLGNYR